MTTRINSSWLIVSILILAASLRLFRIAEHGLWGDEQVSISNAVGSILAAPVSTKQEFAGQEFWAGNNFRNVIEATIQDGGNNLIHNILLHYWIQLWGTSDLSVRLLSVIFGMGVVFLIYQITLLFCSRKVAYCASVLAAVHPFLIRYSQEARSYALATFLSLAATFIFINLTTLNSPKLKITRNWFLYGLLVGLSLLSHYLTIYIFLSHVAYALLVVRERTLWPNLVKAALMTGIIFGGWMVTGGERGLKVIAAINQGYQQRAAHPSADENWALPTTPRNILAGGAQSIFAMTGNRLQQAGLRLSRLSPLLFIPLLLLAACGMAYMKRELPFSALLLLGMLASSSLVFSTILAFRAGHIISFQPLYANFSIPYLIILLAIGITQISTLKRWTRYSMMGVTFLYAAILLVSIKLVYADAPWYRPPNTYQIVSKQIKSTALPGDLIVYPSWTEARLYNLYLQSTVPLNQTVDTNLQGNMVRIVHSNLTQFELTRVVNPQGR